MRIFLGILIWMAAVFNANADKIDLKEVDRRIDLLMDRPEMVGLAVAIVENGEIVFAQGYGVERAGFTDKVSVDTVFRWASLSKGIAGTVVMQQVERSRLDLQSPINAYAPSAQLPASDHDVTIEDVLAQRSGLKSNAYDRWIEAGRSAKETRQALALTDPMCEPGLCHSYQNVIFDGVAEAVEAASGLPYKTIVQREIFEPLGMNTASLTLEGLTKSQLWARPHNSRGQLISAVKPTYYRLPAAAGVNSSVVDLARWMQAQFNEESPLSQFVLQSTHSPRIATANEERKIRRYYPALSNSKYGLGWRIYNYGDRTLVGHRGAVEGYRAHILFDPDAKTGVAVLWNSSHFRPAGLALEVFDQISDQPKRDWMRLTPGLKAGSRPPVLSGSGEP